MKTILKLIISLCLLLVSTEVRCQHSDRQVVWVHGLGGDETSWAYYESIFSRERQMHGIRQAYNTSQGLHHAVQHVKFSLSSVYPYLSLYKDSTMAIGHSMGGLMIRELERFTHSQPGDRWFGGYITVASPNNGAQIANSLLNGRVHAASLHGVDQLTAGPLAEFFTATHFVAGIATRTLAEHFLTNEMVNNFIGNPTTNADLAENSSAVNALNAYSSALPRISIAAEENSPVHWRMFSSQQFGNVDDLPNKVRTVRGVYNTMKNIKIALAVAGLWFTPSALAARWMASEWRKGIDWIDDSETVWNSLIKSAQVQFYTYYDYVWVPEPCPPPSGPGPMIPDFLEAVDADSHCGFWAYEEVIRAVVIHFPSDGLLPLYTQHLNGIDFRNTYHITGANHISVRNMSEFSEDKTRDRFNEIFDKEKNYDGTSHWFHVPHR